jgi:hypothetical protein
MGLFARALGVAAGGLLLVAPASSLAQTWAQPIPLRAGGLGAPQGVPLGPGTYAVAAVNPASVVVVNAVDGKPAALDAQVLDDGYGSQPALGADADGAAVAAWYEDTDRSIEVSLGTASGSFGAPAVVSTANAAPAQATPLVAVSPLGWAAVMFVAGDASTASIYVAVRPPGGAFAAAQEVAPPTPASDASLEPASIAINDRGEIVAAYEADAVADVAIRAAGAGGIWAPAAVLGGPWTGLTASDVEVGIDANGGAVAVWDEAGADTADPFAASVMAAFRPAGGVFAPPQGLLEDFRLERFGLAVSGPGEVILAVHPVDAITHMLLPVTVSSGSTVLGRFGPPNTIAESWDESDPRVAINARGDALLTTDKVNTSELIARRRAPFGEFGAAQEIVPPPYGPASSVTDYDGVFREVDDVALDQFGNATVTWTDDLDGAPVLISVDGPAVTDVPALSLPDPLGITELVAPPPPQAAPEDQPLQTTGPPPAPGAVAPAPTPTPTPAPSRPAVRDRRVALVIEQAPASTGTPRIVVSLVCPTACRAGLHATLITPSGRRIALPAAALALDSGGAMRRALRLSPAALGALQTLPAPTVSRGSSAGGSTHRPLRRFGLTITAVTGDATGVPQTARARISFTRR